MMEKDSVSLIGRRSHTLLDREVYTRGSNARMQDSYERAFGSLGGGGGDLKKTYLFGIPYFGFLI